MQIYGIYILVASFLACTDKTKEEDTQNDISTEAYVYDGPLPSGEPGLYVTIPESAFSICTEPYSEPDCEQSPAACELLDDSYESWEVLPCPTESIVASCEMEGLAQFGYLPDSQTASFAVRGFKINCEEVEGTYYGP